MARRGHSKEKRSAGAGADAGGFVRAGNVEQATLVGDAGGAERRAPRTTSRGSRRRPIWWSAANAAGGSTPPAVPASAQGAFRRDAPVLRRSGRRRSGASFERFAKRFEKRCSTRGSRGRARASGSNTSGGASGGRPSTTIRVAAGGRRESRRRDLDPARGRGLHGDHPGVYCLRSPTSPSPIWKPCSAPPQAAARRRPPVHHRRRPTRMVRKRLREARVSWTTLRRVLAGQQRVTATFRRAERRALARAQGQNPGNWPSTRPSASPSPKDHRLNHPQRASATR